MRRSSLSESAAPPDMRPPERKTPITIADLRAGVQASVEARVPPAAVVWHMATTGDQMRRLYVVELPQDAEVDLASVPFATALRRCELAREVGGRRLLLALRQEHDATETRPPCIAAQRVSVMLPSPIVGVPSGLVEFEFVSQVLVPKGAVR